MEKKKDNDSSIDAEFLTADGVARYMHISRMSVYNLINNDWIVSKTAMKSEH